MPKDIPFGFASDADSRFLKLNVHLTDGSRFDRKRPLEFASWS
jgi:hypothetical protein